MDNAKFGEAVARVMDRMEKFDERGDLEGYELQEVLVVAAFTKPVVNDEIEDDGIEAFVFVDGTTQIPYVQEGVLRLALGTVINPE